MPRRLSMDTSLECTIRTAGALDESWSDYLGGLCVRVPAPGSEVSELSGRLLDQAALLGVLVTLYERGVPLISVACREARGPGGSEASGASFRTGAPRRRARARTEVAR
jgi:hypothetical protein